MKLTVTEDVMQALHAHARATFPNECCGIIVERGGALEAVRVSNVQDERHAQDPEQFPRTAKTAYTMGDEAAPILLQADRGALRLYAFYHSHPQHDAYFSAEDRKQANGPWDEPMYPETAQIVVSIFDGEVGAVAAFHWDAAAADFVEVPVVIKG
jgi:proteasome lid subunit RPN8/RPN11